MFNLGYLGGSCFFQLHLTLFIAVANLSFHRQAQKCNCIYGSGFADYHHSEDEDRAVTHRGSQGTFTLGPLSPGWLLWEGAVKVIPHHSEIGDEISARSGQEQLGDPEGTGGGG